MGKARSWRRNPAAHGSRDTNFPDDCNPLAANTGLRREKWNVMTQIREEAYFTNGRVIVRGKTVKRGEAKKADSILSYKPNLPLSPDFFDLIVIDECHRSSAADDAAWRKILEYFSSATQIGLTATPKETKDVSNIEYFGDPIYTYDRKIFAISGPSGQVRRFKSGYDRATLASDCRPA